MNEEKQDENSARRIEIEKEERMRAEARNKAEKEIKKKKQSKAGIGCLVVIVMLIVIIAILSSGCKDKTETTTEPSTESSTEPPAETSLTPEQKLELAYTQSVGKIMGDIAEAMGYFEVLFQEKPSLLLWTDEEIIYVAMYTVIVEQSYETAKELEPPEKYKTFHSLLLSGLSKYAEAMPLLIYGIDHFDADKINQATELVGEGAVFINQATEEMNELK